MPVARGSATRAMSVIVALGLAVDAVVHIHLAHDFTHVRTSTLSQADLFYVEAALAMLALVGVLVRPSRATVGFAFLVAAGGFVAVVVYRYASIGPIGPIPNMYDPYWAPFEKTLSVIAEFVAAVVAAGLYTRVGARSALGARADARV